MPQFIGQFNFYIMSLWKLLNGRWGSGGGNVEDSTAADTLGQDVYLSELDFHYPIDTIGSRTEISK